MLDFDFKQCTPMHPIYSKEECKNARQVNKNLSYIWVSNKEGDAEVPCTEITHGIQNIIRSAEKNPDFTVTLYYDKTTDGELSFRLKPGQELPKNLQFVHVNELFIELFKKEFLKQGKTDEDAKK